MENFENFENEFEKLLQEEAKVNFYSKGQIVEGQIVKFQDKYAFVDIGQKTEAVINKDEVISFPEGAKVKAVYTGKKTPEGYVLLSRKPLVFQEALERVEKALENKEKITAKPVKKLEKGFIVDLGGLKAFLPYSEAGLKQGEELPETFEVYILKLDKSRKVPNIVVSRKQVLQEERKKKKEKLLSELSEGITVPAKVVKVQDNGAVLSIGDLIYGFLPASLYSWDREKSVKELEKGQEIEVIVKSIDRDNEKIILSRKDLEENPWEKFPHNVGDIVEAQVKDIKDVGLIVKVDGLYGFIHKSETDHLHPERFKSKFKIGQKIKAKIIELDKDNQKLKLSIKQATKNPLDEFLEKYPEGSKIEAPIKDVKTKVAFVDLGDIEGIVHLEDATWNPKIKSISQVLKGKTKETFVVLGKEKDKIKLGIKQLKENPWETFLKNKKVGDTVKGKVVKLIDKGAFVSLYEDVEGFIPVKEITREKIEIPSDKLSLGQEVEAKIIRIKDHDIVLSIKQLELDKIREEKRRKKEEEERKLREKLEQLKPKGEGLATLGEIIKKKLEEKKKKEEKDK